MVVLLTILAWRILDELPKTHIKFVAHLAMMLNRQPDIYTARILNPERTRFEILTFRTTVYNALSRVRRNLNRAFRRIRRDQMPAEALVWLPLSYTSTIISQFLYIQLKNLADVSLKTCAGGYKYPILRK